MNIKNLVFTIGLCLLVLAVFQEYTTSEIDVANTTEDQLVFTDKKEVTFERIVDGDTIVVYMDNVRERVRLIGVDTPESVKQGTAIECFGKESSKFLDSFLSDSKKLFLEFDPASGMRDRNGRLLAHVFLHSGVNVNHEIISQGYGYEYTYRAQNYLYKSDYKSAQKQAQIHDRGLWSPETCNGKTN